MNLHKENSFETEICEALAARGWLYAHGDAQAYDQARALFPADALEPLNLFRLDVDTVVLRDHQSRAKAAAIAIHLHAVRDRQAVLAPVAKYVGGTRLEASGHSFEITF